MKDLSESQSVSVPSLQAGEEGDEEEDEEQAGRSYDDTVGLLWAKHAF